MTMGIRLSVLLCLATGSVHAEDWPTYRHDNRRSGVSKEQLKAELGEAWVYKSPVPPQTAWSGPAKWDAYSGNKDLQSMRNFDPAFFVTSAAEDVYFGSSVDNAVHCLNAVTGKERWVFGHARPVYKTNDSISWYGMIVDISERKMMELELERSRRNLKQAQALTKLGHWEANLKEKTIYWSDMIYTILGWREKPDSGDFHFFRDRTHPDDLDQIIKAERELKPGHTVDIQHRIQHTDGHYLWVRQIVEMEADGEMVLGTLRDITEEKELELKLKEQAERDPLTGAYNRRFFTEALETLVYRSERYEESLAIVTFDIDHFKRINDNFGHEAGDRVLIDLVQTLGRLVRESDIFARTGGEEFSLLLPNQTLQQATRTAERFRAALETLVIRSEGHEIQVTASFGVAIHHNGATHNEVLRHADKALYAAKSRGRNCVVS